MKVTYLIHSSFLIEFDEIYLLFDYFEGEIPIESDKPIYSFSSHGHGDHFSLKLFELEKLKNSVTYILSSDIKLNDKYLGRYGIDPEVKKRFVTAKKNSKFEVDDLEIETLTSTDEGVAFIVSCKGKIIYHGGDLNWWHWEGEPLAYLEEMKKEYVNEIEKVRDRIFDLAFCPLDGRLKGGFFYGLDYFMKITDTKNVIPMHMWEDYSLCDKLKMMKEAEEYKGKIICMNHQKEVLKI